MIFVLLFKSLKQLRFYANCSEECLKSDNEEDVELTVDKDGITVDKLHVRIESPFRVDLQPDIQNLVVLSKPGCRREIGFRVHVDLDESDECVPRLSPPRMPINKEIMTDWIFCHNHDNYAPEVPDEDDVLTSMDQIRYALSSANVASEVLFESQDGLLNMVVIVVNTNCAASFSQIGDDLRSTVSLRSAIGLQFRVLSTAEDIVELRKYRHSFSVDFHKVTPELFCEMQQTFEQLSGHILPECDRLDSESGFSNVYF